MPPEKTRERGPSDPARGIRDRRVPEGVADLAELDAMEPKDRSTHASDAVLAGPPIHNED